jgi:hypothetical protein
MGSEVIVRCFLGLAFNDSGMTHVQHTMNGPEVVVGMQSRSIILQVLTGVAIYEIDCACVDTLALATLVMGDQPPRVDDTRFSLSAGTAPFPSASVVFRMSSVDASLGLAVVDVSGTRNRRIVVVGERSLRIQIDQSSIDHWYHEVFYVAESVDVLQVKDIDIGAPVLDKYGRLHSFVAFVDVTSAVKLRFLLTPAQILLRQTEQLLCFPAASLSCSPTVAFSFPKAFVDKIFSAEGFRAAEAMTLRSSDIVKDEASVGSAKGEAGINIAAYADSSVVRSCDINLAHPFMPLITCSVSLMSPRL